MRHRYFSRLLRSLLLSSVAAVATLSAAAPGDLITRTLTPFPDGLDRAERVVVQADGKPVAIGMAGFGTDQFAMTRYNTNGTIDTTYGASHNGTQLEPLGSGNAEAFGAAFDASGRLVVAGHVRSDKDRFAIARFNADGTLDDSFGGGGSAISIGAGDSGGYAMAMQPDGKILVGGYSMNGGQQVFTVVRYNANDTIDTTFGSGGAYVAPATAGIVRAMALQSTGKLVIAGGEPTVKLQRLDVNGSLDTTFGTGGTLTLGSEIQSARDMVVYPDNSVVVMGLATGSANAMAATRVSADGIVDSTFGTAGTAIVAGGGFGGSAGGIVLDADGSLVLAGSYNSGAVTNVLVAKLTSSGSLDTTFGTNGTTRIQVAGVESGRGIAARSGGGYFVVGTSFLPGSTVSDTLVAAIDATGHLLPAFNATGYNVADLGSAPASANASALLADGKVIVAGKVCLVHNTSPSVPDCKAVVARYNADATLDTAFNATGYVFVPALYSANAVAIDSSGRIVIGGRSATATPSMAFARLNANGTPDGSFGTGGSLTIAAATTHEEINAIAIQASGRIVGAGFVTPGTFIDSAFVGVTTTGSLDTTFGSGGKAVVAVSTGDDEVASIAFQADGKIVGAGFTELTGTQDGMSAVRLTADGAPDATFGNPNGYVAINFGGNSARAYAIAVDADGKLVIGGKAFVGATDDFAVARLLPSGALDTTFGTGGLQTNDFHANHNRIFALAFTGTGKIVGAGEDAGSFGVVQYLPNGSVDGTFGTGGESAIPINFMAGSDFALSLNIASNGNLYMAGNASNAFALAIVAGDAPQVAPTVSLASGANPSLSGQSVTFTATVSGSAGTPTGTVTFLDGASAIAGCSSLALSSGAAACTTGGLGAGAHTITASYSGNVTYTAATSNAVSQSVQPPATTSLSVSPTSIDFGGASMGTTSQPQTISVTNTGTTTVTISGVAASAQFAQSSTCSTLAAGESCTVSVSFSPAPQPGDVNSTSAVSGTLTISSNAGNGPHTVSLAGTAQKSLITHYYESILRRAPDQEGINFWAGEAVRMRENGADLNETWYAMANRFFFSPEYLSLNRTDSAFVTDLYVTFFNRQPDSGGHDFWTGQLGSGMPREVVLTGFLFSPEFTSFSQSIFGNTAARPEINMVVDFYRGFMARLPDQGGFAFWVGQFRAAQCHDAGAVYSQANAISSSFLASAEYTNRNRTNAQFVGDLYNALLRRGGDLQGVQFYIDQLDHGMSRDQVRSTFVNSPEFANRVNAIVAAGCAQ
jgi:uncharacterized delta-60 repeat protein